MNKEDDQPDFLYFSHFDFELYLVIVLEEHLVSSFRRTDGLDFNYYKLIVVYAKAVRARTEPMARFVNPKTRVNNLIVKCKFDGEIIIECY